MTCSGGSALHAAAGNGDRLSVEALVTAGADVNQLGEYDDAGCGADYDEYHDGVAGTDDTCECVY